MWFAICAAQATEIRGRVVSVTDGDTVTVLDAQREAQRDQRGLWAQPHPTPPWQWRHECWEKRACAAEL